ncbi:MAG: hypothetical protein WCQ21_24255 [Verrucomicrobiota bacterium]
MNQAFKNILKKECKGWRAVLTALVLIAVTPLLVCAVGALGMGLRVEREEWKMFACVSGIFIGCGFFFYSLIAAIRWLCCWRNLRRFLLTVASLATLIAIFYTEEDWRGKHAWEQHVREHAARGEKLDLSMFIPPAVPDDQNFCACPLLRPIMDFKMVHGQLAWNDTNGFAQVQALRPWFNPNNLPPTITNGLNGWQAYYRSLTNLSDLSLTNSPAEDVLRVLSRFEPTLAELKRDAARRPLDRWQIQYDPGWPWGIYLPHLAQVKGICYLLQLRVMAYLASGDAPSALSDLQLGFHLANSIRTEPFFISYLVRNACYDVLLEPLREGLQHHQLSDAQLGDLQRELAAADLLVGYQLAMRGDRSFNMGWTKLNRKELAELTQILCRDFARPFYPLAVFSSVAPKGWIYQNQIALSRIYDNHLFPAVDIATRTVPPERTRAISTASTQAAGPYSVLASLVLQLHAKLGLRSDYIAYVQTQIDEAFIACALERYHLAHGEYPETLDGLAPRFAEKLPHDIIDGRPLHYHRTSDGRFLLYSVGWSESDDGGVIVRKSNGEIDLKKGHWAWP